MAVNFKYCEFHHQNYILIDIDINSFYFIKKMVKTYYGIRSILIF
jgi:hypothetical protein